MSDKQRCKVKTIQADEARADEWDEDEGMGV